MSILMLVVGLDNPQLLFFTGQSGDSAHKLLSGPLAKVTEMYQHFTDLESTLLFGRHVGTFLLDIWPYGIMESMLNLNLGVLIFLTGQVYYLGKSFYLSTVKNRGQ